MEGKIYGLICPISKEIRYVGQTVKTLKERLYKHIYKTKYKVKNCKPLTYKENWLNKLINDNVIDKLEIILLEECEIELLNECEIKWIGDLKNKTKLTNLTDGGDGIKGFKMPHDWIERLVKMKTGNTNRLGKSHSQVSKDLIRLKVSGPNNGNYGKEKTQETKNKISLANSGENNGMFGKEHTEESKAKIRAKVSGENNGMFGKEHTEESKAKLSKINSNPIYVLDNTFNIVETFDNMKLAINFFNCKEANIHNARRFKRMVKRKYWVVYVEEYEEFKKEKLCQ